MLKRILTSVVLIPVVVALVLWAPRWLFFIGFLPFALLALWEYLELRPE
jgi:CDP-diglyceride synthetase